MTKKPAKYLYAVTLALCIVAVWLVVQAVTPQGDENGMPFPAADTLQAPPDTILAATPEPPSPSIEEIWADSVMATLSLDHRIAQLLIVHMDPAGLAGMRDPIEAVQRYRVSGFIVPRLMPPAEVRRNVSRLQAASPIPLFIAADYERGVGRYNNNFTELPANMGIGATRDTRLAEAAGRLTAVESRAIGVNLVFAPVVDVNNNPGNPIINTRSYGEDPELVGAMARAFIRGAEAEGVLATAKHFPGHGNTEVDTHISMAQVPGSRADVERLELRPFRMLMEEGGAPAMIMSAHLWMPAIDDEPVPATMSRRVMTDLLRTELGYDGVIITDDIHMGGVTERFTYDESIVRALAAGVDVILTPRNVGRAITLVKEALADGRLSRREIDASVRRVLIAKAKAGLHEDSMPREETYRRLAAAAVNEVVADSLAARAVTLIGPGNSVPLPSGSRVALIQMTSNARAPSIRASMDLMHRRLAARHRSANHTLIGTPRRSDVNAAVQAAAQSDVAVVVLYTRVEVGRGPGELHAGHDEMIRRILRTGTPVVYVTMGNPYIATQFRNAESILIAYDHTLASVRSVSDLLNGNIRSAGRLPISIGGFGYGSGFAP